MNYLLRARLGPVWADTPASPGRALFMARAVASLFAGEGALVLAAYLARGQFDDSGWLIVGLAIAALALAPAIVLAYRRVTPSLVHALGALGSIMIAVIVAVDRPEYAVLYLGLVTFVSFFFDREAVVLHVLWILACLTTALLWPSPVGHPEELSVLFGGTLAGAAALTTAVRGQLEAVIASRSQALAREREERRLLDVFFADAPLAIVIFDREFRYVRVNETYARWLGRSPDDIVGRRLDELLPEIASQVKPPMQEILRTGKPVIGLEARGLGNRVFRSSRYPICDESGQVVAIAAIIDDVTELREAQAALERVLASEREARAFLGAVLDHAPLGVFFAGLDGRYRLVNREVAETRGLPAEEILGKTAREIFPELADHIEPAMRRVLETGEPIVDEELTAEMPPGSGQVRHYLLHRYPVQGANGELLGAAAIRVDITERKAMERRLEQALATERDTRALLTAILDHAPVAIAFVDRDLRYRLVNRAVFESTGLGEEEILGKTPAEVYPELADQIEPAMRRVLETGEPIVNEELTAEMPPGSGKVRNYLLSRYPVRTEEGEIVGVASMGVDITALKELEAKLGALLRREQATRKEVERAATTDALTGLSNRPAFSSQLSEILARARASGRAAALLFLDLDDFKSVNDTRGHVVGDSLLRAVGRRLQTAAREGDVVARVGGDEFIVLLADLDRESAESVAKAVAARVRSCFSDSFFLLGSEIRVQASVGMALFPFQAKDEQELLVLADQAMYEIKRRRKRRAA
ncbi:MAG: hypothetical protein C4305_07345 [Thermoleophilia bacterium]